MALLDLLLLRLAGISSGQICVLLLLFLLKLLAFLVLFVVQLLLLLLVSLVLFRIAGIGSGRALHGRQFFGVDSSAWRGVLSTCGTVFRARLGLRTRLGTSAIRRRMIGASGLTSRNDRTVEVSGPPSGSNWRTALIGRSAQLGITACRLEVLILSGNGSNVAIPCGNFVLGSRTRVDTAFATVVADVGVIHNRHMFVVDVVNIDDINVHDVAVIEKVAAVPASADETLAEIPEAVINPSIEADVRSPVTFVKKKNPAVPTPPRRGPEEADFGR